MRCRYFLVQTDDQATGFSTVQQRGSKFAHRRVGNIQPSSYYVRFPRVWNVADPL